MYLYHYSNEPYRTLLTKRRRESYNADELRKIEAITKKVHAIGDYIDHISFFFDPIPSRTLLDVFDDDHAFWVKGNVIYEHRVDVRALNEPMKYDVVESPRETEILENTDWIEGDKEFFQNYMSERAARKRRYGETGTRKRDLMKQIELYRGRTEEFFKRAPETEDWDENRLKYAATVPHVMIYPKNGEVEVESIRKLTVGDDTRSAMSLESQEASSRWLRW